MIYKEKDMKASPSKCARTDLFNWRINSVLEFLISHDIFLSKNEKLKSAYLVWLLIKDNSYTGIPHIPAALSPEFYYNITYKFGTNSFDRWLKHIIMEFLIS